MGIEKLIGDMVLLHGIEKTINQKSGKTQKELNEMMIGIVENLLTVLQKHDEKMNALEKALKDFIDVQSETTNWLHDKLVELSEFVGGNIENIGEMSKLIKELIDEISKQKDDLIRLAAYVDYDLDDLN